MAEPKNILSENKDGILYLTINREAKLNALNLKTLDEIKNIFNEVNDNKSIRSVILTGAGEKSFAAGAEKGCLHTKSKYNVKKSDKRINYRKRTNFFFGKVTGINRDQ